MISKLADTYAHTTNVDALSRMLEGGAIKSLRHIAEESPDMNISVEPYYIPVRREMKASEAYEAMKENKYPDKIFFTRNGWLPNYGDCVITKQLGKSLREHDALNAIPEEFTTRHKVSLRNNADIYVPDDKLDVFAKLKNRFRLHPRSELSLEPYGPWDRVKAFAHKLSRKIGLEKDAAAYSSSQYKKLFGSNAQLVGSEALGINLPDSSDTDVFVPYKREANFNKALQRMAERYPDLQVNAASLKKPDKKTFTGKVNGQDLDVVVAYGPRALKFKDAFNNAMSKLTDKERQKIVDTKRSLKNAWFFPEWRYKRYKRQLAEELGLKDAYF